MSGRLGGRELRWLAGSVWAGLALFALLITRAASCYAGGSWSHPRAAGFDLWRNFWCDLLRSTSIGGAPNEPCQPWAIAAFALLGLTLAPHWWLSSTLLARGRGLHRALGAISALALALMVVMPSDRLPRLHSTVALSGGALGMGCALWSVAAVAPGESPRSRRRLFGLGALGAALGNALIYAGVLAGALRDGPYHPSVQKLATALLMAWMAETARSAVALQRRSGSARRQALP